MLVETVAMVLLVVVEVAMVELEVVEGSSSIVESLHLQQTLVVVRL